MSLSWVEDSDEASKTVVDVGCWRKDEAIEVLLAMT